MWNLPMMYEVTIHKSTTMWCVASMFSPILLAQIVTASKDPCRQM
jgi:hypothetical protein